MGTQESKQNSPPKRQADGKKAPKQNQHHSPAQRNSMPTISKQNQQEREDSTHESTRNSSLRSQGQKVANVNMFVMGPKSSGKTSFINRIIYKRNPDQSYITRDVKQQLLYQPQNHMNALMFNVIEIDCQSQKMVVEREFEEESHLLVLTYDISDSTSLDALLEQIKKYRTLLKIKRFEEYDFENVILVGTKAFDAAGNGITSNYDALKDAIKSIQKEIQIEKKGKTHFVDVQVELAQTESLQQIEKELEPIFQKLVEQASKNNAAIQYIAQRNADGNNTASNDVTGTFLKSIG